MLLKLTGQWPYQSRCTRFVIIAAVFFIGTSQMVPQAIAIVKHLDDWDFLIDCITPLTFNAVWITKISFSTVNSKKMLGLLNRMRTDWNDLARDRDVDIFHEYAEKGRKITIVYTAAACSTCFLFATQPVVPKIIDVLLGNGTEPGEFPVPVDYLIIDPQRYYFYIYLNYCVAVSTSFMIVIAHDSMFMVYIHHGCGLYAMLGHKLERIGKNKTSVETYNSTYASEKPDMEFKDLASSIDRHNAAIEYAELIEATYSWCFFFIIGFDMFLITVTGLQIVMATIEPEDTIRFIAGNVFAMVHLYVECHMAQILMDHSISIRSYMLDSEWYRLPLKAQKFLLMMIMRCNVPCKITAGKVSVISTEMFKVVLKTSLSYFTFLRSM